MFNIAGNAPSGYDIRNSLRFRSSASAYLSRTPASAGNRRTWTYSVWLKRGDLGTTQYLAAASSTSGDVFRFRSTGDLEFYLNNGTSGYLQTTQVFRDPSAWYHLVFVCDTTNATAANRMRIYVNGSQVTAFGTATYPSLNYDTTFNTAVVHNIAGFSTYFDGYMAEVNFVDGQALTPSSFGSTDAVTGQWLPKQYSSTYGTNGFYLKFADASAATAAAIGKDSSGNANNWTPNNISVTAGTTYDAMIDSPTLTSATVANYATFNPLATASTLANGNLSPNTAANVYPTPVTIPFPTTGKYYAEFTPASATGGFPQVGLLDVSVNFRANVVMQSAGNGVVYSSGGTVHLNGTLLATYSSFTAGDVISVAYDCATGYVWVAKNGTWQNSGNPAAGTGFVATTTASTTGYIYAASAYSLSLLSGNFGQRPFSYTPPTGFVALNTFNLSTPTIKAGNKYMDATLYTGTGSSLSVTNAGGFKPDFVWVKGRSGATDHALYDSVRGTTKQLESNTADAETTEATGLTAFGTSGFTVGALAQMNTSAATYVGWQWQAGQGSTTTGTGTGGITSVTQSVNATAGFSIVTYTGSGTAGTVTHGLGVAPKWIIVKDRISGANEPIVYHASIGNTGAVLLNTTTSTSTSSTFWNNTSPTSTTFALGTGSRANTNTNTYVAYCWAEIDGFSKFGSYTGNGSTDGAFVYIGFRPKLIMIKRTDTTGGWQMLDTSRLGYNSVNHTLRANLSNAETYNVITDILSNGIKMRDSAADINASGGTYVYAAFAENPFKNANAR
jgi:hypothetical protein